MDLDWVVRADCLRGNGLKSVPDDSVRLIFCDLPYGTTKNKWDVVIPFRPLWKQYWRVAREDAAIVLMGQGVFTAKLILSQERFFKYRTVWVKSKPTNFLNVKKQPLRRHEDVCVFYKRQPVYNPQMTPGEPYDKGVRKDQPTGSYNDFRPSHVKSETGLRYPVDVLYFKTAESEGPMIHPNQKPVALVEYFLKTYSNPGDVVLDNCMGAGTTAIAAMRTGRHYIGFEKYPEYYEEAMSRIRREERR